MSQISNLGDQGTIPSYKATTLAPSRTTHTETMAIDLNIAPGEGEVEHVPPLHEELLQVGHRIDLNLNPGTS